MGAEDFEVNRVMMARAEERAMTFPSAQPLAGRVVGQRFETYVPEKWQRDLAEDSKALWRALEDIGQEHAPLVSDVHRWLDARDGFPNFDLYNDRVAFVEHRHEHAKALLAAYAMAPAHIHAFDCDKRRKGRGYLCTCGVGEP